MVTRMERYNNSLEDVKITKRSDKNKDLYEKVKVTEMNPEYIDINTTNVYEIGSINDVTKRRSSYQKLRSLDDVLEKERTITPLEEKPLPKEERLYNIDDILKKAKETYKDETPLIKYEDIGIIKDDFTLKEKYISYLISTVSKINDLKVVFDLANGSSSVTAPEIFNKVLKNPIFLSSKPNGININDNCGSTHLDNLINYVKENKFDLGIAFDGDADRCLFVDEDGNIIDGDFILAIVSLNLKKKNKLKNNTLVGTILSNLGLIKFCNENNINFSATKVGDRYVLEEMILKDYVIGGEQSGHIIFKELATTGDGELTALQILSIISEENKSLKECSKIMKKYPQVSRNIKVKNEDKKEVFTNDEINNVINKYKDILKDTGRIIVRPSGTEPLIRVMIEGNDLDLINQLLNDIAHVIENKIGIK